MIASDTDAALEIWLKSGRLALLAAATAFVSAFAVNIALSASSGARRPPALVLDRAPVAVAVSVPSASATVPLPSALQLEPIVVAPSLAGPAVVPLASAPVAEHAGDSPPRKQRARGADESANAPKKAMVSKLVLRRYGI